MATLRSDAAFGDIRFGWFGSRSRAAECCRVSGRLSSSMVPIMVVNVIANAWPGDACPYNVSVLPTYSRSGSPW